MEARRFALSAHEKQHGVNEKTMKKAPVKRKASKTSAADDILAEYDFRGAAPNRYASRYATGSRVIVLEPDVAAAFPSSDDANNALRTLAALIEKHRAKRPAGRPQ
jgi:hypothetical protein